LNQIEFAWTHPVTRMASKAALILPIHCQILVTTQVVDREWTLMNANMAKSAP
jgi:hypothetical protein